MRKSIILLAFAATSLAFPLHAADSNPKSIVSIYRGAPGRQLEMLKWFAQQDDVAKLAGVAASQLYVHQEGASWDFVWIQPQTSPEQDKAMDAASRKMGFTTGPKMGLQLRQLIAEHTDTLAVGPMTAADWLKEINK
jgi:hypothetical protein